MLAGGAWAQLDVSGDRWALSRLHCSNACARLLGGDLKMGKFGQAVAGAGLPVVTLLEADFEEAVRNAPLMPSFSQILTWTGPSRNFSIGFFAWGDAVEEVGA
jgi:hypothetical protein